MPCNNLMQDAAQHCPADATVYSTPRISRRVQPITQVTVYADRSAQLAGHTAWDASRQHGGGCRSEVDLRLRAAGVAQHGGGGVGQRRGRVGKVHLGVRVDLDRHEGDARPPVPQLHKHIPTVTATMHGSRCRSVTPTGLPPVRRGHRAVQRGSCRPVTGVITKAAMRGPHQGAQFAQQPLFVQQVRACGYGA